MRAEIPTHSHACTRTNPCKSTVARTRLYLRSFRVHVCRKCMTSRRTRVRSRLSAVCSSKRHSPRSSQSMHGIVEGKGETSRLFLLIFCQFVCFLSVSVGSIRLSMCVKSAFPRSLIPSPSSSPSLPWSTLLQRANQRYRGNLGG